MNDGDARRITRRNSIAMIGGTLAFASSANVGSAQAQPIKIGALFPLTGTSAAIGNENMRGFQLAFDAVGNTIAGRPIQLLISDDQNSPAVGLNEAKRLVETEKVVALTGNLNSAIALAVSDYAAKMKVPYVAGPIASELTGSKKNDYTFRASSSVAQLPEPYAELVKRRGFKTGILMGSDYVTGHEVVDSIALALQRNGGSVVKEVFPRLGEPDYSPYFGGLESLKADFVFGYFFGGDTLRFVRAYRASGLKFPLMMTAASLPVGGVAQQLGTDVDGVYSQETWFASLTDPTSKAFIDAYQTKYKETPSMMGVLGYNEGTILLSALRALRGNVTDGTQLAKAIQNVRFTAPGGQAFHFEPNHNPLISSWLVQWQWKDGKAVPRLLDVIRNIKEPATA